MGVSSQLPCVTGHITNSGRAPSEGRHSFLV